MTSAGTSVGPGRAAASRGAAAVWSVRTAGCGLVGTHRRMRPGRYAPPDAAWSVRTAGCGLVGTH
ncbi:hypothetical protein, partial [Streptomyces sp. NPDC058255]|uniref:hypothetical protein n=1 Tax=Streptomyces sp. NPDC058255 TaxID=3346407 RepID=UPI0036EAE864